MKRVRMIGRGAGGEMSSESMLVLSIELISKKSITSILKRRECKGIIKY